MDPVVGIDLGTTNSVVALVESGRVRVLGDREERVLQPSVVSFHPSGKILVGAAAKDRRVIDPQNTVFSIKRLIGRDVDSEEVVQARKRFPFELVEGPNRSIVVRSRGQTYTLPEISAIVLKHMRGLAEASLGQPVRRAVITVPANFNDVQRSSTKVAGRIAGLEVLRILNEPTAAALAYGYGRGRNERIAIYDFGGGTFDVTILQLREHVFEVLATAGDTFLGGDDIDLRLAEQLREAFLKLHRVDLAEDRLAFERLRAAAEQIKIELSARDPVEANIEELAHDTGGKALDLEIQITRKDLEASVRDLVDRTFEVCDEALRLAGISATELDNVILVGGTTRIPFVRQRTAQYFGRAPLSEINPEEVVAVGAAIQGFALAAESARDRRPPASASGDEITRIAKAPTAPPSAPLEPERTQTSGSDELDIPGDMPGPAAAGLFDDVDDDDLYAKTEMKGEATVRRPSPLAPDDQLVAPKPAPPPGAPALPADMAIAPKTAGPASPRLPSSMGIAPKAPPPKPPPPKPPARTASGMEVAPKPTAGPGMEVAPKPTAGLGMEVAPKDSVAHPAGSAMPESLALEPKGAARPIMATLSGSPDVEPTVTRKAPAPSALDEEPTSREPRIPITTPATGTPAAGAPGDAPPGVGTSGKPARRRDPTLQGLTEMPPSAVVAAKPAFVPPPPVGGPTTTKPMAAVAPPPPPPPVRAPSSSADRWDGFEPDQPAFAPAPPAAPSVIESPVELLGEPEPDVVFAPPRAAPPAVPAAPPPPPAPPPPAAAPAPAYAAPASLAMPAASAPRAASTASALPKRPAPRKPILIDVTPQTLGVQTVADNCETVIARNSTIPIEQTRNFSTGHDNQDAVTIRICQGESKKASENVVLGEVSLEGIRPAARGDVTIAVTFEIDADGILQVSAKDVETGRSQVTRITLFGGMGEDAVAAAMHRF